LANDKFVIKDDLVIEVRRPTAGSFVLNYSKLNGTDVLKSTNEKTWENLVCETVSLDIDSRIVFEDAYYAPIASQATLRVKTLENNPDLTDLVYVGLPFRIKVKPRPDTAPSEYVYLFRGSLSNSTVNYEPGRKYPGITFNLTDNLEQYLNRQIEVNYPAQTINERIILILRDLNYGGIPNWSMLSFIEDPVILKPITGVHTVAYLVNEILKIVRGGSAVRYIDTYDSQFLELNNSSSFEEPEYRFTVTNNLAANENELTYSSITSSIDSSFLFNQVVVQNDEDGTVITSLSNITSINVHGLQSLNVSLQTEDTNFITSWAQKVIDDQRFKTFVDINISGLDTNKKVNKFVSEILTLYPEAYTKPIRVIQDFYGVNTDNTYPITRVSQSIDADSWAITLDTGKGVKSAT